MWKIIAANTIRQSLRAGALPVTLVTVTLLLWLAGYAAYRNQQQVNAQREFYNRTVRVNWLQQPDRHPHRVSHYGYLAFREKSPLSFVDSGVDNYAGTAVFLEAHRQNPANFSEAGQSAALSRFGELTPALVLQLVIPLLVFFLGFAAVSGEREDGTWPLMLAQGVSPRVILAGKTAGLTAVAVGHLVPGLLGLALLPGLWAGDALLRLALLALVYGVYVVICALVAVGVSAVQPSSRASLSALLVLWVVGCVVMPRALQAWGAMQAPLPSRAEFEAVMAADLAAVGDSHNPNDPHYAALRAKTLAEHKVTRVEDLPFNYSALVMMEGEAIGSRIFERYYGQLLATLRRQGAPLAMGAVVNPYLAVRRISAALAGSDLDHFAAFQRQAETFRFQMVQRLNELHLREIKMVNDRGQKVGHETWADFPAFVYRAPALGEVMAREWMAVAALGVWFGVLAVGVVMVRRV